MRVIKYLFQFLSTEEKGRFRQTCKKYRELPMGDLLLQKYMILHFIFNKKVECLDDPTCSQCHENIYLFGDAPFCSGCENYVCDECVKYVFTSENKCLICEKTPCQQCGKNAAKTVCYVCKKIVCCFREVFDVNICYVCLKK